MIVERLIKLLISLLFFMLNKFFRLILHGLIREHPSSLVVLMYHEVTKKQRDRFGCQMDELLRVSRSVINDFRGTSNCRAYKIAVTFDDGFQCILENALPELERRNIPAILFIPTGYLGKGPGFIQKDDLRYLNEIIINSEQLKYLSSKLVAIGSHTVTHPHLTHLSEENLSKEFIESKYKLENILNKKIELLAFPHGEYNQRVIDIAKQVGYKYVFAATPVFNSKRNRGFLVGRIAVSPDDWFIEFKLKLKGAYQWLPIGFYLKRKYSILLKHLKKNYNSK